MVRTRIIDVEKEARAPLKIRQPSSALVTLSKLLHSHTFVVQSKIPSVFQRICQNLQTFGGQIDENDGIYIGESIPLGVPSIGLGDRAGTLGPMSVGFVNNVGGVAAFSAPMLEKPKQGTVGVIFPRRDSLPEVIPLLCKHRLGISWVISVGDGDPSDVLRFLSYDPATTGVLVALGRGTSTESFAQALGSKPAAFYETESFASKGKDASLCRAVIQRAGFPVVPNLEDWLAHGALFDANIDVRANNAVRKRTTLFSLGAGTEFIAKEAKRVKFPNPVTVELEDREALESEILKASKHSKCIVLCGEDFQIPDIQASCPLLHSDPAQPERLRALFQALAYEPMSGNDLKVVQTTPDADLLSHVTSSLPPLLYVGKQAVSEELLSDHDTKRFLHAYGARVSRQAPANTVTAACRIASKIQFPVVILPADLSKEIVCQSLAEIKYQATLALAKSSHIFVREYISEGSRFQLKVSREKSLGLVMWVDNEVCMVPVLKGEAKNLAEKISNRYPNVSVKALTDCLGTISTCSHEQSLLFKLEIQASEQPIIVKAEGRLHRST